MTGPAGRSVAVVLDGPRPPAWQVHALELLALSPQLKVSEVRLVEAPQVSAVSRLHRTIEQHLFKGSPDPLAPTDFDVPPANGAQPELTLWLASAEAPPGGSLIELRYGPHGERADAAFRRAIKTDAADVVAEARLQRSGAVATVVARAVSGVRPFSLASSLNLALWRSATLACRAAERLPGLDEAPANLTEDHHDARALPLLLRSVPRWGKALLVRLVYLRPWYVLVRERRPDALAGWGEDVGLVAWKRGHTYADPFLFEHGGRHHLFLEDVAPGTGRGVISHVEIRAGRPGAGPPVPVLEEVHHLSYPFVFAYAGSIYMIPETAQASQIRLYRASSFPSEWELDRVLVDDIVAADATVFEADGRWWMFASVGGFGTTLGDELHLFLADTPLGPWIPHVENPVVSDIRSGRPAGAVLRDGDRLVRPAQDGSRRYGWAVSLREIVVLTEDGYEEREIGRLESRNVSGARAVHTYGRDSRFEVIDARRREWRARAAWSRLKSAGRGAAPRTARSRG